MAMKRISHRFAALLLAIAALPVLAACDSRDAPVSLHTKDTPEIRHCLVAVERLARNFEDVKIVRVRDWEVEKILNVGVTYDYTIVAKAQGEVDESLQGLAVCRYEYGLVRRNNPKRKVKAMAIRFRGRALSANELILLDTAIAGKSPRLRF